MKPDIHALNLDFDTTGGYFKGKSTKEVRSLMVDYYEKNQSLKDIADDLGPGVNVSQLRKHFPKVNLGVGCKYDGSSLYVDLPNKQIYQQQGLKKVIPYCRVCGHKAIDSCTCEHCLNDQKRKIEQAFPRKDAKQLEGCTLYEKVVLATLLQGMQVKTIDQVFGSFDRFDSKDTPLFIDGTDGLDKLKHLFNKGILTVSSESRDSAFVLENNTLQAMYPTQVYWQLNVTSAFAKDKQQLFQSLKYPSGSTSSEGRAFDELWCNLIVQELYRCVCMELKKHRFSLQYANDKEKIEDQIIRLLELYTPGQIYALFWTAIRYADNNRTEGTWGNFKYHHINFVIQKVDQVEQKKHNKGEEIATFHYPDKLTIMLYTKIFFHEVAHEPGWFYKKVPKTKQISYQEDKRQFYDKLLKRETQQFTELHMDIKHYYVTSYGIVIYDGCVNWLFTDEKTLYLIAEKVGFDEFVVSHETFYSNLQTPYYINDMYSMGYLIELVQFLKNSNYKYYIPKEDSEFKNKLEKLLSLP